MVHQLIDPILSTVAFATENYFPFRNYLLNDLKLSINSNSL